MFDVVIIGAGVVGSLIAYRLSAYDLSVCVLDSKSDAATGASGANSGIVHAGFDAECKTLKAELNVRGAALMPKLCDMLGVEYRNNGSLVIGFGEKDSAKLNELFERGVKNGVQNLQLISAQALHGLEPHLSPDADRALFAPSAGIVCPYSLTIAALGVAMDNGCEFIRNFKVDTAEKSNGFYRLSGSGKTVCGKYVINAAGVYSDKIASLVGDSSFTVTPRRGEYVLLDRELGSYAEHTVFCVPSKMGKGILVSPTAHGNLILGPTSENISDKSDVSTTQEGLNKVLSQAKIIMPSLKPGAVTSFTGLRAVGSTGDFIIKESAENFITLGGIESPGLTSSPAIAEYVLNLLFSLGLKDGKKYAPILTRKPLQFFSKLSPEEKDEYIKKNPAYGRIVCRCETITEGEITDALHTNPIPTTLDGIKHRVRAGMGRCQGGFCSPRVMQLISEQLGIPFEKVTKCGGDSYLTVGRTK